MSPYNQLIAHMAKVRPTADCSVVRDAHPGVIADVLRLGGLNDKLATLRALKEIDPYFYRHGQSRWAAEAARKARRIAA